ncbi:MAG: tyrosine-type recombinase/integrase [Dysgonomonas sp.]
MATLNYYFRLSTEEREALAKRRKIDKPLKMLYARLRDTDTDIPMRMGVKLDITRWNNEKQQLNISKDNATDYDEINSKLRNFKTHINNEIAKAQISGEDINSMWFENQIKTFFNRASNKNDVDIKIHLVDYIKYFIEKSKVSRVNSRGRAIGKRTIQDYEKTLHKLENYEKLTRRRVKHLNIDLQFHGDFIRYCREYELLSENTIGGEIKNIKTFLHSAELDGIKVNQDFKRRDFYQPNDDTHDIVLDESEIQVIAEYDFNSSPRLDNVRDWLIIGLWSGLRVGDLLSLTHKNVEKRIAGEYIVTTPRKTKDTTNTQVVIPIHPNVKSILEKRNGNFPDKISDQKFNDYIKEVAEKAGLTEVVEGACMQEATAKNIDGTTRTIYRKKFGKYPKHQLVTSHTCRRSFATNLYGKVPNFVIMAITGHQSERIFLKYIKKTPNDCADNILDLWSK